MKKFLIQLETAPGTIFPDIEQFKHDLRTLTEAAVKLNTTGPIPAVTVTEE